MRLGDEIFKRSIKDRNPCLPTKMLLSLQTKAESLFGALHLFDSASHNVAVRFKSI